MLSSPRRRVRPDYESSRWTWCVVMRSRAWVGRRFGEAKPFRPKTWKPTTFAAPTRKFSRGASLNAGQWRADLRPHRWVSPLRGSVFPRAFARLAPGANIFRPYGAHAIAQSLKLQCEI